ncbi:MAG: hypothetical protein GY786_05990 [Proteobacteria bacterium]|nr:hypothetical protein [Pseudomonadota bacterium]
MGKRLKLKFQEAAHRYFDILDQISQEELELIAERVLTCETIEAVFVGITKKLPSPLFLSLPNSQPHLLLKGGRFIFILDF